VDRDSLVVMLGRGLSLAEIGRRFDRHESTVAYWVAKHGLKASGHERHSGQGRIAQQQLGELVLSGASIAEIADHFGRSRGTVRYWLGRYGLKTRNGPGRKRSPEAVAARDAGLASSRMYCRVHGETEFWIGGRGSYRCKLCRGEAVTRRRRKVKMTLVAEAGGACRLCGYSTTMRALHFHHIDPADKRLEINARGASLSLDRLRAEAQKCVLLCSNCHAEVESGLVLKESLVNLGIQ
jgi:transposase